MNNFDWPLMHDNIIDCDINKVIEFLEINPIPKLTNGPKVLEFEKEWSEWLGVNHSLMVNSGSSANELTMLAIKFLYGSGEVILPPLTWISDISSVIFAGLDPVFCDINLKNLSFDTNKLRTMINKNTKAIFITHVLGINAITNELLDICKDNNILLIEDVCESHGTRFMGQKAGSIGFVSNFSFYFAHHMSTIEGGMVCTDNYEFYQICRALRSHGMSREINDATLRQKFIDENLDLNSDFIFIHPSHNFRSTEINAVIGLSQLSRLDDNNLIRSNNFNYFITRLDSSKYYTDFSLDGQCNYAFIVIMKDSDITKRNKVEDILKKNNIEFRRGLSGGGNQLRQPFFKNRNIELDNFPNIEHIHNFSWYIGNYPSINNQKIDILLNILNNI